MQGPTIPRTPPPADAGERACPACGAANRALAAFCWRCYRPFGTEPGTPFGAASLPAPPPAPRRRRALGTVVAIALGVAISAGVAWVTTDHAEPALPEAFGGLQRVHGEDLDRALATFTDAVDGYGFEGDIAVYGPGIPSVALAWISGGSDAPLEDFDAFAAGFGSTSGGDTLDTDHLLDRTAGGTRYRCAPIVGSVPATLCVWQDGEVYWALYDLRGSDPGAAFTLARSARTATS
jgi:hypothetical protein